MSSDPANLDFLDTFFGPIFGLPVSALPQHEQFPLISINDVAKQYGISLRTIRRWQAAGLMPSRVRRRRRLMYRKAEVAAMMMTTARQVKHRS